jgi:hypothetical protein
MSFAKKKRYAVSGFSDARRETPGRAGPDGIRQA